MAQFIIPTLGTYWRNIESDHQTKIEWKQGETYTFEVRREGASTSFSSNGNAEQIDHAVAVRRIK